MMRLAITREVERGRDVPVPMSWREDAGRDGERLWARSSMASLGSVGVTRLK